MPKKTDQGQAAKIKWVIKKYYDKGKSRPEAVKGLMREFGVSYNYARTIIYNHLCYLDWARAPYPKNRKTRRPPETQKTALKEKFKPATPLETPVDGEVPDDFDF